MSREFAGARGQYALRPADIPKRGWRQVLLRVKDEVSEDNLSVVAAGVGFYSFLSLVPAIGAFVLIYGLISEPGAVEQQLAPLKHIVPDAAYSILTDQLHGIAAKTDEKLGLGLLLSLLLALWGSTRGMKALMAALNIAYEEREKRGIIWQNVVALLFSLGAVIFVIVSLVVIAAIPAILDFVPLGEPLPTILSWLRWLVMAVLVVAALGLLYRYGPNRNSARWRWITPGAILAAVLWLFGSVLFSFYVSHFGNYNETFGSLATVVVLLLWLYLSAFSICLGAELNAELERQTYRDSTVGPTHAAGSRGARVADHTAEDMGKG